MSVFKLSDDHLLVQAGLRCIHLIDTAERGLRVGDVVFDFPFGRIIDTGMACRRDGIIPPGVDLLDVHKEAIAARAACKEQADEGVGCGYLILFGSGLAGLGDFSSPPIRMFCRTPEGC